MARRTKVNLDALAHAAGRKAAQSAFDSGDYDYHAKTKGLSAQQLREDMWSFEVEAFAKQAADEAALKACAQAWARGWQEQVAEVKNPKGTPMDALLAQLARDGELDFRSLPKAKEVPRELLGLSTVKAISLRAHRLTDLEPLFTMPNVERAYLAKLGLKAVPPGLARWQKLRWLSLAENPLTDLSGLTALTTLRSLTLGGKFKALPENLGDLVHLEELDLFQPSPTFDALPPSMAKLKKLEVLRLPNGARAFVSQAKKLLPRAKVT